MYLCIMASVSFCGCAMEGGNLERRDHVYYYDRNGDGIVDLEKHHYGGVADADWQLRDDDYDGRYEKKIQLGVGVIESAVDLPVPTRVRIEAKP